MPFHQFIYGAGLMNPNGHEEAYKTRYMRHVAEVHDYFKDRPCDFLEFDYKTGRWAELAEFLEKEAPPGNITLPHFGGNGDDHLLKKLKAELPNLELSGPHVAESMHDRIRAHVAATGGSAVEVLGEATASVWWDDTAAARAMRGAYDQCHWIQSTKHKRKNKVGRYKRKAGEPSRVKEAAPPAKD